MQESAPEGLITTTAQGTADLHSGVQNALKKMGHPSETVPDQEQPVLSKDLMHAVGSSAEEALFGKGPDTDVRVTAGARLRRWIMERVRRKTEVAQRK